MRKEDKARLPPKARLKLPPGYYLIRQTQGYLLYQASQVTMGGQVGVLHVLVGDYERGSDPAEIEAGAWEHHGRSTT